MDQRWLAVAGVCVLALGAGWWFGRGAVPAPATPEVMSGHEIAAITPIDRVVVHVAGLVLQPGVYRLDAGSRVVDAIEAAGGAAPGADLAGLNLAADVTDGQQIYVPAPGGAVPAGVAGSDQINLNAATIADLETLPGVGPVLADRIVAYRETHGPFSSVDDLLAVPGIGESKLAALREDVVVP